MAKDADPLIRLGAIAGAHGVRGLVTVKSETAEPEAIAAYGPLTDESGRRQFRLSLRGRTRGLLIAAIEGVGSREAAQALRHTGLYLRRSALPQPAEEDEVYYADLIGLRVEDSEGAALGIVQTVDDHGAGDLLTVRMADGRELLLPFTKACVPELHLDKGFLVADPPEEILVRPGPKEEEEDVG